MKGAYGTNRWADAPVWFLWGATEWTSASDLYDKTLTEYEEKLHLIEKFIATKEKVHLIDRYANDYISSSDIDCIHKIQDIAKEIIEDF